MMASLPAGQFRSYSIEEECEFTSDGTRLRFGHDLVIEGKFCRCPYARPDG